MKPGGTGVPLSAFIDLLFPHPCQPGSEWQGMHLSRQVLLSSWDTAVVQQKQLFLLLSQLTPHNCNLQIILHTLLQVFYLSNASSGIAQVQVSKINITLSRGWKPTPKTPIPLAEGLISLTPALYWSSPRFLCPLLPGPATDVPWAATPRALNLPQRAACPALPRGGQLPARSRSSPGSRGCESRDTPGARWQAKGAAASHTRWEGRAGRVPPSRNANRLRLGGVLLGWKQRVARMHLSAFS